MAKLNKNTDIGHVNMNRTRLDKNNKKSRPTVSSKKRASSGQVAKIPPAVKTSNTKKSKNSGFNISRRAVILGACGAGAVAAGGFGIKFAADNASKKSSGDKVLEVDAGKVLKSDDLEETPTDDLYKLDHSIDLPEGSLAWANNSSWIACLIPTGKSKSLNTVELIDINSGERNVVIKEPVNMSKGFEIYDVRANDTGIVWTEVNILDNKWYVYASKLTSLSSLSPQIIDKGNELFDVPFVEVTDNKVVWSIMPKVGEKYTNAKSLIRGISFSSLTSITENEYIEKVNSEDEVNNSKNVLISSPGRMQTPIYSCGKKFVVTPRADRPAVFYQLTCVDEEGKVLDSATLPQNMKPLEAGYGNNGFHLSFDAIYNYGGGIANLGTYTPTELPSQLTTEGYSAANWFNFARTPSAPPCWCGNRFIVKSLSSVCCVDIAQKKYCVLDRPNASDDFGDYLASTGTVKSIVTYAKINDTKITGDKTKQTTLRIWKPI